MTSRFSQGLKTLGADAPRGQTATQTQPRKDEHSDTLASVAAAQEPPAGPGRYMAPSRQGKKAVAGYFDPAVRQQLAVLAAEEQRSQNDLLAEALNLLFERYGKSPLA